VISKTELSAGDMAPLFTSSRLEAVMLNFIIWTSSSSCVNLGRQDLVRSVRKGHPLENYLALLRKQFFLAFTELEPSVQDSTKGKAKTPTS
jgi:hypothetical protein